MHECLKARYFDHSSSWFKKPFKTHCGVVGEVAIF